MHQQEMNRLEVANASDDQLAMVYITEHLDYLEAAIKRLQSDIDDHIAGQPELSVDAQLLTSIPGLGSVTVAKVLAHAGNISRFDMPKHLAHLLGYVFSSVCQAPASKAVPW